MKAKDLLKKYRGVGGPPVVQTGHIPDTAHFNASLTRAAAPCNGERLLHAMARASTAVSGIRSSVRINRFCRQPHPRAASPALSELVQGQSLGFNFQSDRFFHGFNPNYFRLWLCFHGFNRLSLNLRLLDSTRRRPKQCVNAIPAASAEASASSTVLP